MIPAPVGPKVIVTEPLGVPSGVTGSSEQAAAPVLPSPSFISGDPIAMIAQLFIKNARQKQQSENLSARTEDAAEDAADTRRVEAMEHKADLNFAAGVTSGFSQVASGACSFASAASGMSAMQDHSARAETFAKIGMTRWDGASQLTSGLGKGAEAGVKRSADSWDEKVARAESEAKVHKRASDALRKESDAAAQHESKVTQLLQEIRQAQAQCEKAALFRA